MATDSSVLVMFFWIGFAILMFAGFGLFVRSVANIRWRNSDQRIDAETPLTQMGEDELARMRLMRDQRDDGASDIETEASQDDVDHLAG